MIIKNYIKHPIRSCVEAAMMRQWLNWMGDEKYIKLVWKMKMDYPLDLKNPKTFNEKMQWLKLYDRKKIYNSMVDKYEVKKIVGEKIGTEHVIPTLAVWNSTDDIDLSVLPDKFVLKCTHDSGGLVICRDKSKLNVKDAKEKLNKSVKNNYYNMGREWPYKNVTPRILEEEYVQNGNEQNLTVYKIFNCSGQPTLFQVIQNDKTPEESIDYFDNEWNRLNLKQNFPNSTTPVKKPKQLGEMLEYARRLSKGFPFLRTDFYIVNGHVYFSEFTFYSDCGFKKFDPPIWDEKLGALIDLSLVKDV